MLNIETFAQVLGIVAMVITVSSFQCKSRKGVIILQFTGSFLFGIHFYLLGAMIGALLNVFAVMRGIVYLDKSKTKGDSPLWLVFFTLMYVMSYVLVFTVFGTPLTVRNIVIELLPVVGLTASTYGFGCDSAKKIRVYSLICSPCWLIYNCFCGSIGAILTEVISLASIIVGILRFDIKKCEEK